MNKFKKIFLILSVVVLSTSKTFATELPKSVENTLRDVFPKMVVRFDSLIDLSDGTQYLPVYPPVFKEVEDPSGVKFVLPKNKKLEELPDLVQFNNGLALFKIIRKPGMKPTLIDSPNIPIDVKLGLLPQDLLVPEYLVIPMELRIILGDLFIPVKEEIDEFKYLANIHGNDDSKIKRAVYMKNALVPKDSVKYKALYDKSFYVINYKTSALLKIDPEIGRPSDEIKLGSLPYTVKTTWDNRYLLAPSVAEERLIVIDTVDKTIIKKFPVGIRPNSVVIDPPKFQAFVANAGSSSISIIDLKKMEKVRDLSVEGSPTKLTLSDDFKTLAYVDSQTSTVYKVRLDVEEELYVANPIIKVDNISQVVINNGLAYLTLRTQNKLLVVRASDSEQIASVEVGSKPVDVKVIKNKIYVLSAGSDEMLVFNKKDYDLLKVVKLNSGGFPKTINLISHGRKALISSPDTYELLLFNFSDNEVEQRIPVSVPVNSIVVTRNLQ